MPPSQSTHEAIKRLATMLGVSLEAGWHIDDAAVSLLIDRATETIPKFYLSRDNKKQADESKKELESELTDARQSLEFQMKLNREVIEREKLTHQENERLRELASISYEMASYANESLPTNQPEFLEGLIERIEAFEKAHTAIFNPENP